MFLARTRRMPLLRHTEKQYRILENEDRTQQDKRRRDTDEARCDGMAFHQHLGMPTETQCPPTDFGVVGQHAQLHIPSRPEAKALRDSRRRISDGCGE